MNQQGSHGTTFNFPDIMPIRQTAHTGLISTLQQAVVHPDHDRCGVFLRQACAAGLAPDTVRDVIIPAVARHLGDMWRSDNLAFADVTIATARLQGLVRTIAAHQPPAVRYGEAPTVCVIVPAGTHHTLGATILVQQLRQRGLSARFMLDATPGDLRIALKNGRPDAVFISSIAAEKLDQVAPIVEEVRKLAAAVPVVVGGPDIISQADIRALTGADHATREIETALELCGLNQNRIRAISAEMMD